MAKFINEILSHIYVAPWLDQSTNYTIPVISINHYFPVLNLGKHCYCKFCYVMNPIEVTSVHT